MRRMSVSGGEVLETKLQEILKKVSQANMVKVGFLEGATYPDEKHTPVAMVAAIQNFGAPAASIPARPFFTNMVREKSGNWGKSLASLLVNYDYDAQECMKAMGEGISDQLVQSIKDTNAPPLSPITLMLRKMRSEGASITGASVGEAAARVASGESTAGVNAGILIDTGDMLRAVGFEVSK